jgi:hypothetical protein
MNFMEMVLALFAIILFTSVSLIYNHSMWNQAESLDKASNVIQATQLAHSCLDEVDAKLFSKDIAFKNVGWPTSATGLTYTLAYSASPILNVIDVDGDGNNDYKFNLTYNRKYCDSLGVALATQPATVAAAALLSYFKVTVTIAQAPGMQFPVSVTRVYTKTSLNL